MIYLNGKYLPQQEANIAFNDRGFLLGDGIFETVRVYDGKVFCFEEHYERLINSAELLEILFFMSASEVMQVLERLLEKNNLSNKNASIRMTLTRGTGPRGLLPPEDVIPTLMITVFPYTSVMLKHLKVCVSDVRRNEFSPLSRIKSLCYLDNVIARNAAAKDGFDDCIILNTQGNVACASAANIFIVTSTGVMTPRLEDGVLPGITRKTILKMCHANNICISEASISEADLLNANEVFLTNSLVEIQPVIQVNKQLINDGLVGKITSMLQTHLKNAIETYTWNVARLCKI